MIIHYFPIWRIIHCTCALQPFHSHVLWDFVVISIDDEWSSQVVRGYMENHCLRSSANTTLSFICPISCFLSTASLKIDPTHINDRIKTNMRSSPAESSGMARKTMAGRNSTLSSQASPPQLKRTRKWHAIRLFNKMIRDYLEGQFPSGLEIETLDSYADIINYTTFKKWYEKFSDMAGVIYMDGKVIFRPFPRYLHGILVVNFDTQFHLQMGSSIHRSLIGHGRTGKSYIQNRVKVSRYRSSCSAYRFLSTWFLLCSKEPQTMANDHPWSWQNGAYGWLGGFSEWDLGS